jgi:hypothetical protein
MLASEDLKEFDRAVSGAIREQRPVTDPTAPQIAMKPVFFRLFASCTGLATICSLALLMLVGGCGKKDADVSLARNPKEAAIQLDQAFGNVDPQIRAPITVASEAMRTGDYEKAVMNLQLVKESNALNVQQGLAIHGSVLTMEAQVVRGVESGDPRAIRAYELLKAMKRK